MRTRGLHRAARLTAVVLPIILAFDGAAAAQCERAVEQTLQQLGVPQDDVESVQIKKHQFSPNPPTNYEYNAWIRLDTCGQGYLVVNMTRACYVKQSYTRDDCQVSGVPRY